MLQAAEARLKDFKLKYLGVTDRVATDYFARMAQLRNDIEAARMDMHSMEQARDTYKRELAGEAPPTLIDENTEASASSVMVLEIDTRIAALRKELDGLRRKYTDQHPDVAATNRLVEQLEEQRAAEVAARQKAAPKSKPTTERNPVSQQLRISLAEAEASLASARSRVAGYESQYKSLMTKAARVPETEAEYTQLNRDYEVQKKTYESLLARRESALMGKDMQDTGGTRFRVIDPPRVSSEPVPPRRLLLLAVAMLIALAAGVAASFVVNQISPIFSHSRALRDAAKRPILGTISLLASDRVLKRRRRYAYLFAGGVGGLFASFAAIFAFMMLAQRVA